MTSPRASHYLRGVAAIALLAGGCNNRQAFTRPEPGLERMLQQPRGKPYRASRFFEDGRMMRVPPPGTVRHDGPRGGDTLIATGADAAGYARRVPIRLTADVLRHGRAVFEDVCATCHGILGDGVSFVAEKMELRKPPSFFEPRLMQLSPGRIFEIASKGYGLMPSYAGVLSAEDRWAVIGYIDALRVSQSAKLAELPPELQRQFREAPQ